MSKVPFRPGGEIPGWGGWTPGNLRVHGVVPGSAQAQALMAKFGASVHQFYLSQAHNAQASELPQWAKTVDLGDHRISYVRQFGLETVTLIPSFEAIAKVEEELKKEEPWDFCVVDFVSPLVSRTYENESIGTTLLGKFSDIYVRCTQVERNPNAFGIEHGAASLRNGVAYYISAEDMQLPDTLSGTPMLAWFSLLDLPIETSDQQIAKGSLKIDLRRFKDYDELEFEVYANLLTPTNDTSYDQIVGRRQVGFLQPVDFLAGPGACELAIASNSPNAQDDILTNYPSVAALASVITPISGSSTIFNNSDAACASATFRAGTVISAHTERSVAEEWFSGWLSGDDPTSYQAPYEEVLAGDTEGYPWDGDAVGIYKWRNAGYVKTSGGEGQGVFELGAISTPPPYAGELDDANYTVYMQWAWFIFAPIRGDVAVPVTVDSTMTISAAMFRGDVRFEERTYNIEATSGDFDYSEWWVEDRSPRFNLGTIGSARVSGVQLEFTTPPEGGPYYEQYVQANGRPYVGKIVVSPKYGYARFVAA